MPVALPTAGARDLVAAALWQAGALGMWEREHDLVAWFPDRVADVPDGGTWSPEPDRDWQEAWKATVAPVRAGRIVVVPSWLAAPRAAGDPGRCAPEAPIEIVIDPGRAFGTGHHATTVGCLLGLQRHELAGRSVLDVGTGTGVLAIAAARLGAATVVGVDTDPDAIAVARDNVARADVDVTLVVGSVRAAGVSATFDFVVANLLTETVLALAPALAAATRPAGTLLVSGISADAQPRVTAALRRAGAAPATVTEQDGWVTITATRTSEPQQGAQP